MKKVIGCLLIGLSFLTTAIIIAIGEISVTLKEVASGNYSWSNSFNEVSILSYIAIVLTVIIGIYLIKDNNSKEQSYGSAK
ncbi:hypothetical protein H8S20_08140 [Clostridium sp. NSJ-6]|uniref:Uncharacterized protein n=1 Tax=Clostridium hominis TaxID=2763036 RepID=A0ABR7DBX5_9CLOT|nr:hypothetical protein [Clostridium hominis]MBC5628858.1 hypothetical protein [Clostridium hominis]